MILGISIIEDKIYVSNDKQSNIDCIPFIILRNTENNSWQIGAKAIEESANNKGILIDKLLYMFDNNSYITISNNPYQSKTLIEYFFRELLIQYENPEYVYISLYRNDAKTISLFSDIFEKILGEGKTHIASLSESYIQYAIANSEISPGDRIGLIDFSNKMLCFYELNVRNTKNGRLIYMVDKILNPSVTMDLISGETGAIVADNILSEFAKRVTKDKEYAYIYLTGEGLQLYTLYKDFINFLCTICPHVVQDTNLFALGTLKLAEKYFNNIEDNNFYITDMRVTKTIKIKVTDRGEEYYKNIFMLGDEWFYTIKNINLILDNTNEISFLIEDNIKSKKEEKKYAISEEFIDRQDKTNMISLRMYFSEQNIYEISIKDQGFGEFYEKRGLNISYQENI